MLIWWRKVVVLLIVAVMLLVTTSPSFSSIYSSSLSSSSVSSSTPAMTAAAATSISSATLSCNTSTAQYHALHDLYQATEGYQWKWKANYTKYGIPWNFNMSTTFPMVPVSDPCVNHWQGITCSTSCHILSLVLSSYKSSVHYLTAGLA